MLHAALLGARVSSFRTLSFDLFPTLKLQSLTLLTQATPYTRLITCQGEMLEFIVAKALQHVDRA